MPKPPSAARRAALILALALPAGARAATPSWEKLKLSDHIESLKFGGDFRVRNDNQDRRTRQNNNRNRFRFRLRLGAEAELTNGFLAGLKFASGTGEQVSTNQSYDNLSSQKEIWVDQAYLKWSKPLGEEGSAYAQSGRMPNSLWLAHSSQIVWDDDFNPEGASEGVEWLLPGPGVKVFANALQMVADEDSGSARNQWLFTEQAGAEMRLPWESRFKVAAAYHKWTDENRNSYSQVVVQNGNRRNGGGALVNRFGVGELTGQLSTWIANRPLTAFGTAIRNLRARGDLQNFAAVCANRDNCPAARDGFQYGLTYGKAANAGTWEATYSFKRVETDATIADISDSDFGEGGTNRQGHYFILAYAPLDWMTLRAKYYTTKVIDRQYQASATDANRLFCDLQVKF